MVQIRDMKNVLVLAYHQPLTESERYQAKHHSFQQKPMENFKNVT